MGDLMQIAIAGVAVGALYGLVALGFSLVYRSSGVLNLAHGGFLLLGAYLAHTFGTILGVPYALAVPSAMAATAGIAAATHVLVLRDSARMPTYASVLLTVGILIVIEQAVAIGWGHGFRTMNDPWGTDTMAFGGSVLPVADAWTMALALVAIAATDWMINRSSLGLAIRASASDSEAAVGQGIDLPRVGLIVFATAAALAALAGTLAVSGPRGLTPDISHLALRAFPALIVGGLTSLRGAALAGVLIGVVETATAAYAQPLAGPLGQNLHLVVPYLLMVGLLVVRPHGLARELHTRTA